MEVEKRLEEMSLEELVEALPTMRAVGEKIPLCYFLVALGIAQRDAGHHDEAISSFREARELADTLGILPPAAAALRGLGITHQLRAEHHEAARMLAAAAACYEKIASEAGQAGRALSLAVAARSWQALSEDDRATRLLEEAIRLLREINRADLVSQVMLDLALLLESQARFEQSREQLDRLIESMTNQPSAVLIEALLGLSRVLFELDDWADAVKRANQAVVIAATLQDPELEWKASHRWADAAVRAEVPLEAAAAYDHIVGLCNASPNERTRTSGKAYYLRCAEAARRGDPIPEPN